MIHNAWRMAYFGGGGALLYLSSFPHDQKDTNLGLSLRYPLCSDHSFFYLVCGAASPIQRMLYSSTACFRLSPAWPLQPSECSQAMFDRVAQEPSGCCRWSSIPKSCWPTTPSVGNGIISLAGWKQMARLLHLALWPLFCLSPFY